ncbi:MAG: FAD-dependent thymidylate synthase [Microgenomates group bacterium]
MDRKEAYPSVELPRFNSRVSLILHSTAPLDTSSLTSEQISLLNSATTIVSAAARTCYSSEIQTPLDYLQKSDKYRQVSADVVISTKEAGHNTTRQHASYTFALENVSRLAVNFLHSQPFYNSEEMSQRYVNMADTKPLTPDTGNEDYNRALSEAAASLSTAYNHLQELLTPTTKKFILERFPGRDTEAWKNKINNEAGKKSQEIARYLLPLGMPTNLHFTINELTLKRFYHLSQNLPATDELSAIIQGMVDVAVSTDPSLKQEFDRPLPYLARPRYNPKNINHHPETPAVIDNLSPISPHIIRAIRRILGVTSEEISDQDALKLVFDPNINPLLAQVDGDGAIDHLSQSLNQVNLSAEISLSHTANYQLHRHRALNHTTPLIIPIPQSENDYVIPPILNSNPEAYEFFLETLALHSQKLQNLFDQGISLEHLQYLIPNAVRINKTVSGPFGAWYHFLKTRNCFNAQEEINAIATSITKQIIDIDPVLSPHLEHLVPCGLRQESNIKPFCPEGTRFCGVRIWNFSVKNYPSRNI